MTMAVTFVVQSSHVPDSTRATQPQTNSVVRRGSNRIPESQLRSAAYCASVNVDRTGMSSISKEIRPI
jgi:hypothetical protein